MTVTAGKFTGKIVDYGMRLTKAGLPMVTVRFKIVDTNDYVHWTGTFNEGKPQEITIETLVNTLGFEGNDFSILCDGASTNALNSTQEYVLNIEKNDAGYFNVKSVYLPGSESMHSKNSKDEIIHAFKGLSVNATLASIRANKKKTTNIEIPF